MVLILSMLISFTTNAQEEIDLIHFVDEDGIHLRWTGHHRSDLEGYHVYRRLEGKRKWVRLTTDPIRMISKQSEIEEYLGPQAKVYYALFGRDTIMGDIGPVNFHETSYSKRDTWYFNSICLVNHKFGVVLGEIFHDYSVKKGESYEYKITLITDEETDYVVTEIPIKCVPEEVPGITGLETIAGNHRVDLRWYRDDELVKSRTLVSYNVYRSTDPNGPFEIINEYNQVTDSLDDDGPARETDAYLDRFLENGKSYWYEVRAVNAFGIEGPGSFTGLARPEAPSSSIPSLRPFRNERDTLRMKVRFKEWEREGE